MSAYTTQNPSTGTDIHTYELMGDVQIDGALDLAVEAFSRHRYSSFEDRARKMMGLADLLERESRKHAELMTQEMGKPIKQAVAEVRKCTLVCRYYAENTARFLADEPRETEADNSFVAYEPLGPVLAVMPWNFPYWQVFRFATPAVMAGNVGLLKHAKNVLGCGEAIAGLFKEAGFEAGVFQHLPIPTKVVDDIIRDARVTAVTLTGSEGAGKAVGGAAGEALKPSVLELGGSDAFIVLADADLDRAIEVGVRARTQNNGESCIAAKRFILEEPIAAAFTERFVKAMEKLSVGDPMDDSTDIGPLARKDLRDEVHDQVQRAVQDGAEILCGGSIPDGPGFFYPPTVLSNVNEGTVAFREEIFGPVASLIVANDAEDAVRLANASRFGLGGAVFTQDRNKGVDIARKLEAGCAFVNEMTKSHPNLPFGGVKDSGYGRELARHGMLEFVNTKTIWVD
ncbi:MAG: NAD-dependent succinate-semialdehyde dehydrogenase [Rubricoccaceae bacterium]|nr:NAD-dependent succinate-semialdehyde dehydrogenase [Rubricoccaceae bacterium]